MNNSTQNTQSKGQFINGRWINSQGKPLQSHNPSTGELFWQGSSATEQDVHSAFESAKKALAPWSSLDFLKRAEIVQNFAREIEKNREQLTYLISTETGKPLWESKTEVDAVIGKVNLSIQAYQERTQEKHNRQNKISSSLRFKPHGVVAVLGAFNFPAHLSNGHIVPALLAGNTILYKPSELSPAVAELVMQCWQDSGLPEGVMNCLQGGAECGRSLLSQDIQGVYFTGSYPTGLKIHHQFAERPEVIVALEMGGNNPLVIGEVKDMRAAVYHSILSCFITAGQRCTCARRLIIPNNKAGDEFLRQFIQATGALKVGDFNQSPEPFIGPVISYQSALQHLKSQEELLSLGAKALIKMELIKNNTGLLSPGILDMTEVQDPVDTEIFAPLVQVYRYEDFEHAISLANQTRYGLSAGLLSDDPDQYDHFFKEMNAGLINWNRPTTGATSSLPFGGIGLSGNHRPSAYFAADYCAYPIASQEESHLNLPAQQLPGLKV